MEKRTNRLDRVLLLGFSWEYVGEFLHILTLCRVKRIYMGLYSLVVVCEIAFADGESKGFENDRLFAKGCCVGYYTLFLTFYFIIHLPLRREQS